MRIYVDHTEPGALLQALRRHAERQGIPVERTVLHKREPFSPSARQAHPFYGMGADFIIADDHLAPIAAIERKTLDDLSRSLSVTSDTHGNRMFRQLKDLTTLPMPILLLEGNASFLYRQVEAGIIGFQFWCAREGVALMYTTSLASTAKAIHLIARKLGHTYDQPGLNDLAQFLAADPDRHALAREPDERPGASPARGSH